MGRLPASSQEFRVSRGGRSLVLRVVSLGQARCSIAGDRRYSFDWPETGIRGLPFLLPIACTLETSIWHKGDHDLPNWDTDVVIFQRLVSETRARHKSWLGQEHQT